MHDRFKQAAYGNWPSDGSQRVAHKLYHPPGEPSKRKKQEDDYGGFEQSKRRRLDGSLSWPGDSSTDENSQFFGVRGDASCDD